MQSSVWLFAYFGGNFHIAKCEIGCIRICYVAVGYLDTNIGTLLPSGGELQFYVIFRKDQTSIVYTWNLIFKIINMISLDQQLCKQV